MHQTQIIIDCRLKDTVSVALEYAHSIGLIIVGETCGDANTPLSDTAHACDSHERPHRTPRCPVERKTMPYIACPAVRERNFNLDPRIVVCRSRAIDIGIIPKTQ